MQRVSYQLKLVQFDKSNNWKFSVQVFVPKLVVESLQSTSSVSPATFKSRDRDLISKIRMFQVMPCKVRTKRPSGFNYFLL